MLAEHTEIDARRHGELLAPGIEKVLAAAGRSRTDLTGIAVGVGPGPFTGLRVGLVTARALGDALDIPVHGVCTLDILAAAAAAVPGTTPQGSANNADTAGNADVAGIADIVAASADGVAGATSVSSANSANAVFAAAGGRFAVATDARRREVYWAVYDLTGHRETDPAVDRPADIAERLAEFAVAGQGPLLYPDQFPYALSPALPSAAVLAELVARRLREAPEALLPPIPLYLRRPDAVEPGARKSVTPA